ncbi:MAG: hypothetical protein ACN6NW_03000 [Acinetobacter amyesii]|uniref:hypothetical protein n=1 Tax=Acinetobacter amyesii TaxID=2942470 RepID=UPI003D02D07C
MSELEYSGKPLAYLDQNILDLFTKKFDRNNDIYPYFNENFQVVYSDTTLGEIYKAFLNSKEEDKENILEKYLNILEWLNAYHIRIAYNRNLEFLDSCVISQASVRHWFNNYVENKIEWGFWDQHIYNQFLLSYQKHKNIDEIKREALLSYEKNLEKMRVAKDDLQNYPQLRYKAEAMYEQTYNSKANYEQSIERMLSIIMQNAEQDKMSEIFRNEMGISAKQLNNINMPHVVEKIWNLYKDKEGYQNFTIDDFWSINLLETNKGRKFYKYEKINVIYNMMNFIGFYSDTKLDQVNGVQRSMSDFTHAQIASFCHFFFTNDKNLIKKVDAIYEYLDVPTRLARIDINSN